MNPIEQDRADHLAGALFDEMVVPLAEARRAARAPGYFPVRCDARAHSYFKPAGLALMTPADFEFPGEGTARGLIEELAAYWKGEGETALAAMSPRLVEIAQALGDVAEEGDGNVDILCYTMF